MGKLEITFILIGSGVIVGVGEGVCVNVAVAVGVGVPNNIVDGESEHARMASVSVMTIMLKIPSLLVFMNSPFYMLCVKRFGL